MQPEQTSDQQEYSGGATYKGPLPAWLTELTATDQQARVVAAIARAVQELDDARALLVASDHTPTRHSPLQDALDKLSDARDDLELAAAGKAVQ